MIGMVFYKGVFMSAALVMMLDVYMALCAIGVNFFKKFCKNLLTKKEKYPIIKIIEYMLYKRQEERENGGEFNEKNVDNDTCCNIGIIYGLYPIKSFG
jgi:hypothetical protein